MREVSFFHKTEDKTLHQDDQECSGGKKLKTRLTISLCVWDKETPLVIQKSLIPHCFKHVNQKTLSVEYYANKKAWIKSGIFEIWLKKFDKCIMGRKGRKFC